MPYLALFFMGQPRIELNGAIVKVPLKKALALLSYLAVTNESHSRETLAALLWPEYNQEAAFNTLRVSLHTLRKVFGEEWFCVDRDQIGLAKNSNVWVDVQHFHNLVTGCQSHHHSRADACVDCINPLTEAIQLYRGNFLAGLVLQSSTAFDDWQRFQNGTLLQETLSALKKLVHCHSAQGEFSQAITYTQQWLAFDPLDESAHQTLMQLYAWSGQRSAALNQYREYCHILEKELAESPQESTEKLYQAIKEYRLPPPPTASNLLQFTPRSVILPPVVSASPFLGREKELTEIAQILREPACRLLSLIGPGGIGKTRLALEVAVENASVFPNGIWFTPLVTVKSPELIASAVVNTLGLALEGEMDIRTQLFNHLRNRKVLLILDNFEHLVGGSDLVVEILKRAPGVKVMITSSERLNLQLEWLYQVRGLNSPENEEDAIEEYSAVQLFLQSARRSNASFSLLATDRSSIVRICRFLEGMPLGIELAAAWTQMLSCQEISEEIERDLDFLSVSARDIPERHRSLRAVYERSWKLLSDDERNAMRKLSVFHGSFQREAAEQIAGVSLDLLSSLMNKSFLQRSLEGRYEILETLRKYVREKLGEDPRIYQETHNRHAEYYAAFLQAREARLKGIRQIEALEEISREIENIRLAWQCMVSHGNYLEIDRSQESLYLYYSMRSWLHEGVEVFGRAVETLRSLVAIGEEPAGQKAMILARLLARQGYFYDRIGRYEIARELLQESLSIFGDLGIQDEMALPLRALARVSLDLEDYAEARRLFEASLEIYKQKDDQWGVVRCLDSLGFIALYLEEYSQARQRLERGLLISKETGDQWGTAWCLMDLGFLALIQRKHEEAELVLQECLTTCSKIGDYQGIATTLSYLALVAVGRGEYQEARQIYQREIASWQEFGYQQGVTYALMDLGLLLFMLEEYSEARKYLQDALDMALIVQSVPMIMRSLAGVVTLMMKEEKDEAFELIERTLYHPIVYEKVKDVTRQLFSSIDISLQVYAQHNPVLYREFMNGIQEINKVSQAIRGQADRLN
ncbi:MAG TPA: tetratricopeptide repeat protein [Anaerolineales bacterium]|nr:tetratricopeptide repeat protein [Anaerolineales bacterium]